LTSKKQRRVKYVIDRVGGEWKRRGGIRIERKKIIEQKDEN
jgi:hypothetical protein